jgi:hypothetical protein
MEPLRGADEISRRHHGEKRSSKFSVQEPRSHAVAPYLI